MLKKILGAGLAILMIFFLCSCQKTPSTNVTQEHQEDISFISVMLGDKNIEECNGNNVIANVMWNSLKLSKDDEKIFPELKKTVDKLNSNALKDAKAMMYGLGAAAKENGAMAGFMGMGMAGNMMGNMASFTGGGQNQPTMQNQTVNVGGNLWKCECGTENTGKFCPECGDVFDENDKN